ncbi:hypothetical protein [Micromonospora sp. NBC_00898]|uniref:hypothetical protein n=1 Tax=Micromonospora sp. NBC_00898 TaxID=2975981 RepID=UPI00386B03E6
MTHVHRPGSAVGAADHADRREQSLGLDRGPETHVTAVRDAGEVHAVRVGPKWTASHRRQVADAAQRLALRGLEGLFDGLHPAMPRRAVDRAADPLGRVLGATRAAVLRRLAEPGRHTTTALARAVDHTGGAVRHRLTPLGLHLLGGAP